MGFATACSSTEITDAGIANLNRLTRLRELDVGYTRVTGTGLAHLNRLTSLRYLRLDGCEISDAGLASLKGLTGLETLSLDVDSTDVTDAGIKQMQAALPKLQVT